MANEKAENISESKEDLFQDSWKIRNCDLYEGEYKDCKSFKARFNQYFIFGETVDCNPWKIDHGNCVKWVENEDVTAYNNLIQSEDKRRADRLRPHVRNDVWKKRDAPPKDWNKPLPSWLEEENKNSYLHLKAEEMKENGMFKEGERTLCVIS